MLSNFACRACLATDIFRLMGIPNPFLISCIIVSRPQRRWFIKFIRLYDGLVPFNVNVHVIRCLNTTFTRLNDFTVQRCSFERGSTYSLEFQKL